mgnify:FL=1
MELIYHITTIDHSDKHKKNKTYKTLSLEDEGFIHCSPKDKVRSSTLKFFSKEKIVLLLFIDQSKVLSEIIWEDSENNNYLFPHIYGELNIDAVTEIIEIISDGDGLFIFPEGF